MSRNDLGNSLKIQLRKAHYSLILISVHWARAARLNQLRCFSVSSFVPI